MTDLSEEDVKLRFITPALVKSDWRKDHIRMEYFFTDGQILVEGKKTRRGNRKKAAFNNPQSILSKVTRRIIEKKPDETTQSSQVILIGSKTNNSQKSTNLFPNLSRKERKLVYSILDVIRENMDLKTFTELQNKIVKAVNQ